MDMASLSSTLLFIAFIAYLVATFLFGGAVKVFKYSKLLSHLIDGVN